MDGNDVRVKSNFLNIFLYCNTKVVALEPATDRPAVYKVVVYKAVVHFFVGHTPSTIRTYE